MTVLNVVACVILFAAVAVFATPADSVPNENEWLITAQESIKDSLSNLKSYGADTDKIKEIANEAFDAFTMFVRNGLSDIIKQTDDMEPEEISELRVRLVNWSDALLRLNR